MHQLEEEHAETEYQIRCLMLRPESNKTDSDKTKEEELIKRYVFIRVGCVGIRNNSFVYACQYVLISFEYFRKHVFVRKLHFE